jgi:hypothetical protein
MTAETIKYLKAEYSNYPSPPPFLYQYKFEIEMKEGNYEANFDLKYLERNEIDEDEIYEEGFTLKDDYSWRGQIPEVWLQELKSLLSNTKEAKGRESADNKIHLEVDSGVGRSELLPMNQEDWEYFMQELIQAIYELDEKENPYKLIYKELSPNKNFIEIDLIARFAHRNAEVIYKSNKFKEGKTLSWPELKSLMKIIYLPDYDYEEATEKEPKRAGKYLNTGEGLWFEFGKTVTNPGKSNDVLKKVENSLKGIFDGKTAK